MKSLVFILTTVVLSLSVQAEVIRVCGGSQVGSASMAESNLTRELQKIETTHQVVSVSKSPTQCYTSSYGIEICKACADVVANKKPELVPEAASILEPKDFIQSEATTGAEVLVSTECEVWHGNPRDGYRPGMSANAFPGPCTDEIKSSVIGYRRNGKPKKDDWKYLFVEAKTYKREVSVTLTYADGSTLQWGPIEQVRNTSREYRNQKFENPHVELSNELNRLIQSARRVYWTQSGVCYREQIALIPSSNGELPRAIAKRVPLEMQSCTQPAPGTIVVEQSDSNGAR